MVLSELSREFFFALLAFIVILPPAAFAAPGSGTVEVNGSIYEVHYDATGLDVLLLDTDDFPPTLIVLLATTDVSGTLQVTLERGFLDARSSDGSDDDFLVLLDGIDAMYAESVTATARTLTIQVPSGTISVDIIGTHFGATPSEQEAPPVISEPEQEAPVVPPSVPPSIPPTMAPETVCGPGTMLQDGTCVAVQTPPPTVVQPPVVEESVCGPGTVLKDGACVLDQTCGPGTILVDGQCVLDTSRPEPQSSRGMAFEFVAPMIAALIISLFITLILWAIGKAGRKKD